MQCLSLIILLFLMSSFTLQAKDEVKVDTLYNDNCATCHGINLEGGLGLSLIDDEWIHGKSAESIAKVISHGVADTEMMAFGEILSSATG